MRKAFIFDLDGTLIDTAGVVLKSVNHALEPWGIKLTHKDIETIRERCTNNLFSGFGLTEQQQIESYERLKNFTVENLKENKLFEGVLPFLDSLFDRGFKLGLWTGRDSESTKLLLGHLKIEKYFGAVIGNSDVCCNKPHQEGLKKVMDTLGVHPVNAVMVGDHDHDIVGGKRLGSETVRVCWTKSPRFEYGNIKADWRFDTPQEFLSWTLS